MAAAIANAIFDATGMRLRRAPFTPRGYGPVRFSSPLVFSWGGARGHGVKVLFLDKSGGHSLSLIDPQYPLFVLGGVVMEQAYSEGPLVAELNAFKMRGRQRFG